MKERKQLNKTKPKGIRGSRSNAVSASCIDSIQSSLEMFNDQLGNLTAVSEKMESVDTFIKERLAAKSRDNLRIENLKKIFRLIYGNQKFVSTIEANDTVGESLASLQRRLSFLKRSFEELLIDEGVRVIAPSYNDPVSESEHRIVQDVAAVDAESRAGHVAECLEIGFAVHGIITPAEVTVFSVESDINNPNTPPTQK